MDGGLQQLSGDWFLFVGPLLAGVAVFLVIWLVLRGPLRRLIDRVPSKGGPSWHISKTFRVPLGPSAPGVISPGQGERRTPSGGRDLWRERGNAQPLGRSTRREHYEALWRQTEAQFAHEPAEAVRGAERLLRELMREERSPSIVLTRTTSLDSDAEFGAALGELGSIFREIGQARAAARGISSAQGGRDASVEDLRQAMELYRRAFEQRLGAEHGDLDPLRAAIETPAASGNDPNGQWSSEDPAEETARERADVEKREQADAERIVREAMAPLERAETRRTLVTLGHSADVLARFLSILLCVVAIVILVGGVFIMLTMDAGSRGQGGRFYVAIIVLLLLGAVDTQFVRLLRRRARLSPPSLEFGLGPQSARTSARDVGRAEKGAVHSLSLLLSALTMSPTDDERRYALGSLVLLLFLAVVLGGFALLVP